MSTSLRESKPKHHVFAIGHKIVTTPYLVLLADCCRSAKNLLPGGNCQAELAGGRQKVGRRLIDTENWAGTV